MVRDNGMNDYMKSPMGIEAESFRLIQAELEDFYCPVSFESDLHRAVIFRAIHTSADFDYYENLIFSPEILPKLQSAFLAGALTIFTDTTMALSGINKRVLERLGVDIQCAINWPGVAEAAMEKGITRSMAAVDAAVKAPGKKLFVFGNAPTALFRLMEQPEEVLSSVVGIVGVPVGFVGAAESKQALAESELPHIAALGRKGGSNIAAAIINAILYSLSEERL